VETKYKSRKNKGLVLPFCLRFQVFWLHIFDFWPLARTLAYTDCQSGCQDSGEQQMQLTFLFYHH
jgi:hypothetical protein